MRSRIGRHLRWSSATGTFALLLTLTACTSEVQAPTEAPVDQAVPTISQVPEPTRDAALTPEPQPSELPGGEGAEPAHCLHGTWIADNAFYLASLQDLGGGIDDVSGVVELTFDADGATATTYKDWQISASPDGEPVTIFRDGTDTGLYALTGETISVVDTAVGSTMTVIVGGATMPIEPEPTEFRNAAFSCGPHQASIEAPEGILQLTRD